MKGLSRVCLANAERMAQARSPARFSLLPSAYDEEGGLRRVRAGLVLWLA